MIQVLKSPPTRAVLQQKRIGETFQDVTVQRGYYHAHNPLIFTFASVEISPYGYPVLRQIVPSSNPIPAGATFQLNDQVFTAADTIGTNQFFSSTAPSPNNTQAAIFNSIANAINNSALAAQYKAVFTGGVVYVLGNAIDPEIANLNFAGNSTYYTAPLVQANVPKYEAQTYLTYQVFLDFSVFNQHDGAQNNYFSDTLNRLYKFWLPENRVPIDVSPLTKDIVRYDTPVLPVAGTSTPPVFQFCPNSVKRFYVRYGERVSQAASTYAVDSEPQTTLDAIEYFALNSQSLILSPKVTSQPQESLDPYWRHYIGSKNPLSFEQEYALSLDGQAIQEIIQKETYPFAPELLYCLVNDVWNGLTNRHLTVQIVVTFTDGSTQIVYYGRTSTLNQEGLWLADISPVRWNYAAIQTAAGKTIDYFRAAIFEDYGDPNFKHIVTFPTTYKFRQEYCYDNQPVILFLNDFGVFDCFWMRGLFTIESSSDGVNYFRSMDFAPLTLDKTQFSETQYKLVPDIRYTANSGWVDYAHFQLLKSLVKSPVVFWSIDGNLMPIIIDTQSIKHQENNIQFLFNMTFTFRRSVNENFITN